MNIKEICLDESASIIEAMKIIDKSVQKIALVVDANGKLLGTITDGDIRRGLIKNIATTDSVTKIMNRSPVTFSKGESPEAIEKTLTKVP